MKRGIFGQSHLTPVLLGPGYSLDLLLSGVWKLHPVLTVSGNRHDEKGLQKAVLLLPGEPFPEWKKKENADGLCLHSLYFR